MPYVSKKIKDELELRPPESAGELAYCLQQQLNRYLVVRGEALCFSDLANCLGALEAVKQDFTESILLNYESGKRNLNGDCWSPDILKKVVS